MSAKAQKTKKHQAKRQSPYFLEYVKLTSFGRFSNEIVGPFKEGLTVVFGENEAGKTTINELIKGVLFGWPLARGQANAYKPEAAERAGSLFFRNGETDEALELARVRNTDKPADDTPLLGDIDQETYNTIFALTSDELLRLDRHSELTSRLLTAGAGTSTSPAQALEEIEARIKEESSRSAAHPLSLANLRARREVLHEQTRKGLEAAETYRAQEQALRDLEARKETLAHTHEHLNAQIEHLKAQGTRLRTLNEAIASTQEAKEAARRGLLEADEGAKVPAPQEISALVGLSAAEERALRDAIDDLEERQIKLEHLEDNARRDANKSRSEYEVLTEDVQVHEQQARAKRAHNARIALAVALPLFMLVIAGYLLYQLQAVYGLRLSYLIGAGAMVLFALLIAAVGIAFSLRPSQTEEQLADRQKKTKWVMQQDQKTLESCERDSGDHQARIENYFESCGLGAAHGSPRRARRLLDEAREFRQNSKVAGQNAQALDLQMAALRRDEENAYAKRSEICQELGILEEGCEEGLTRILERKTAERTQTIQLAQETAQQIGEITQLLSAARSEISFDQAKFDEAVNLAQLEDAHRRLAVLFLARDALRAAISEWEQKSQPVVYAHASRLFSQITEGAWKGIRMNAAGEIEALDAYGAAHPPQILSLGTRQQLYLALRIALLLTAENVGRGLPVLCDDILINFDEERRAQAALALVELARYRQVILFTCHKDVASLISSLDPKSKRIEL